MDTSPNVLDDTSNRDRLKNIQNLLVRVYDQVLLNTYHIQKLKDNMNSDIDTLTASMTQLQGTISQFIADSQRASQTIIKEIQGPSPDLSKVQALADSLNESAIKADKTLSDALSKINPNPTPTPVPNPSNTSTTS